MIDWETRLACASESDESLEEMSKSVTSSIEFEQTHYLKVRKFFEQKVQQAKELLSGVEYSSQEPGA